MNMFRSRRSALCGYFLLLVCLLTLPGYSRAMKQESILSPDEVAWMNAHGNTIVVQPGVNVPPFSFVREHQNNSFPQGYGIDFIGRVAEALDLKVEYREAQTLTDMLEGVKDGEPVVLVSLAKTPAREESFIFTEPYVSLPAVFVVRSDSPFPENRTTVKDFKGKTIAVARDSSPHEFLKINHPELTLDLTVDGEASLKKMLLGEVDAAVLNIASLSYFISNSGLSSIHIAGPVGFDSELAFAIPKDSPELASIIQKGMNMVTQSQREFLRAKWINFEAPSGVAYTSSAQPLWADYAVPAVFVLVLILIVVVSTRMFIPRPDSFLSHVKKGVTRKQEALDKLKQLEQAEELLEAELRAVREVEKTVEKNLGDLSSN